MVSAVAPPDSQSFFPGDGAQFYTTHWSVVQRAAEAESPGAMPALENLCRTYWYPVYAYVRRQGREAEEAKDLTQEFFHNFLRRGSVGLADPARGKFREFLLGSVKHFLVNEWHKARRLKRGGGQRLLSIDESLGEGRFACEPVDPMTPETLFERRWAQTLLETVLDRVRAEFAEAGREDRFAALRTFLLDGSEPDSYADIGQHLGLGEAATKSAIHRLRKRFAVLLREEITRTVSSEGEVDAELRHLFQVLTS